MLLAFGSFRFDARALTLYQGQRMIPLTAKSAQVLALLLERPGDVVTKDQFLSTVWKDTFVEHRGLTQCIFMLRKALDDQEAQALIETVAKRGYRFAAPVTVLASDQDSIPAPAAQQPPARAHFHLHWAWAVLPFTLAALLAVYWMARASRPTPLSFSLAQRLTWSEFATEPDIAADGSFVVFCFEDPATHLFSIQRQNLPSGLPYSITPPYPEPLESPAISPDLRRVAYRSTAGDGILLTVPADGSAPPTPIPDTSRGRQPRWQPGRNAISYWVAAEEHIRDIAIVQLQSVQPASKPIRMFDGFDTAYSPIWSPDGNALLALGTAQSAVPDREFDAWVNPFQKGVSTPSDVRTGLFPLLQASGLYSTVRDRSRISVTAWRSGFLYLSIVQSHAANLYRVPIGADFRVFGAPERLTTSTHLLLAPRASAAGAIVASSTSLLQSPWRLSLDGSRLERLPADLGWLSRLSLAASGQTWAAEVYAAGVPIRIFAAPAASPGRILASGSVAFPVISPDGASVAYRIMDGRSQAIDIAPLRPGVARRICADCGAPEEWSPNARMLLYHTGGVPARIGLVPVDSGQGRDWLIHPDYGVFGPRLLLSSDNRGWVAFYAENSPRTRQVFVAPIDDWQPPPVSSWIPISDGSHWDSSPVWSPAGDALFFVSLRDGHRCIYRQALHPATRRPLGEPVAIRHFHSSAHRIAAHNRARGADALRIAGGALYFILDTSASDAWLFQPAP